MKTGGARIARAKRYPKDAGAYGGCDDVAVGESSSFVVFLVPAPSADQVACDQARYTRRGVNHNAPSEVFSAVGCKPAATPHLPLRVRRRCVEADAVANELI